MTEPESIPWPEGYSISEQLPSTEELVDRTQERIYSEMRIPWKVWAGYPRATTKIRWPWMDTEGGSFLEFDLPEDENGERLTAVRIVFEDGLWCWTLYFAPGDCPMGCGGTCVIAWGDAESLFDAKREVLKFIAEAGYDFLEEISLVGTIKKEEKEG